MTYSTSNPPALLGQTVGGNKLWYYTSADDDSTVIAAGYISNATKLGMATGDAMLIYDTATPKMSVAGVTSVGTTGSTMAFAAVS